MKLKHLSMVGLSVLALPGLARQASAALALQLKSSNYNPTTGIWLDSSGNSDNATYSGSSTPTLNTAATPNGSPAVVLSGSGSLLLGAPIDYSQGYTVFAYAVPVDGSGRNALTGGSIPNALEWDIYGHQDDFLREYIQDVAHGATTIPTTGFSLLDLAVNSSGSSFNYNGAPDSSSGAGATFGSPITRIGNNEGGGDGFVGQLAEIDIYTGVLTPPQIAAVEAQFTASYVSVPEPGCLGLLTAGAFGILGRRRRASFGRC